ncbi:MAG: hypothetical protein ACJAYU_002471 [Bradymonadia bacterium]|jgi:hypothetical protein
MSDVCKISIAGAELRGHHCEFDHHGHRRARLNTAKITSRDLDWTEASSVV